MSERLLWIVAYDVCDDRRLRRVMRTVRDYGDRLQLSVWRCELNARELAELEERLAAEIDRREDKVLFVPIGPRDGPAADGIRTLGLPLPPLDEGAVVV